MTRLAVLGVGTMGRFTAKALSNKVDAINLYDPFISKTDMQKSLPGLSYLGVSTVEDAVKYADYVVFCVPTDVVQRLMTKTLPYCKPGALISGQTSRKTPEATAFDRYMRRRPRSGLNLVSIHTMCNPDKSNPAKEIFGIIRHNPRKSKDYENAYDQARDLYSGMSEHIEVFDSVAEHDSITADTQGDTSRTNLTIASSFAAANCFPWLDNLYGSPFDSMKFSLAMRTASFPVHVYREIQFGSDYLNRIASRAMETERNLYKLIVAGKSKEYRKTVMAAKEKIYGDGKQAPILGGQDMKTFDNGKIALPNSHLSIIQWFVAAAESGRNPFKCLKGTTPMHTALLCLADRLFTTDELEQAIEAPFNNPELREDDFVFYNESNDWFNALLYQSKDMFNSKHALMRRRLDDADVKPRVDEYVGKSVEVVRVCRESMNSAMSSGRLDCLIKSG